MVLLPVLSRWGGLPQRRLYATCVAVIFPVCAVSAMVYLARGGVSLEAAAPYLAGGLEGGFVGGKLYGKVSVQYLRWMFAAFLLYAGGRYLLRRTGSFHFYALSEQASSPPGAWAAGHCYFS